jgi:hypothetical protein
MQRFSIRFGSIECLRRGKFDRHDVIAASAGHIADDISIELHFLLSSRLDRSRCEKIDIITDSPDYEYLPSQLPIDRQL